VRDPWTGGPMVSFVDKWIGNIFTVLENGELLDNTLLLFTAHRRHS